MPLAFTMQLLGLAGFGDINANQAALLSGLPVLESLKGNRLSVDTSSEDSRFGSFGVQRRLQNNTKSTLVILTPLPQNAHTSQENGQSDNEHQV